MGPVYDRGANFIADASGGANYFGLPLTGHAEFPRQHPNMKVFTSIVRPTCGCELIASRQFPEHAQGNFLVNNNIGFQGIKQHKVIAEGSGFTSKEVEPLLFSTDKNFRPVDIKFGPDGALYIVDWFNPLIGHMQYSIRDPGRNHFHGRIWRITAKNRPLVEKVKIAGAPIAMLLDLLKEPEDRTRYRVRAELRERDRFEVKKALDKWVVNLKEDADHEHHLLEALWVYQGINQLDEDLLVRLLHAKDFRARGAATRALRNSRDQLPIERVYKYLAGQVNDEHIRVRLEAVVALSYFKDARAAEIALDAVEHPTDYYLDYGLKETIATLQPYWRAALTSGKPFKTPPKGAAYLLASVTAAELVQMARSEPVYLAMLTRDGVAAQFRKEALEGLAKLHKTDYLTELFEAIERADGGHSPHSTGGQGEHVIHELAILLTARDAKEVEVQRGKLEKLATRGRLPLTRQVAYAALAHVDKSVDRIWADAANNKQALRDVVDAIAVIENAKLRATAFPKVKELLAETDDALRLAAINTIASIPGHEAETFATLAGFVLAGKDRDAAIRALRRLPKKTWPEKELQPLAESLLEHVKKLDVKARTESAALDALQLGNDLAVLLNSKDLQTQFGKLGVHVILIRTIPHSMVFDVAEFTLEAGKPAVIVLENNDIMPHNLLITEPGMLAVVGQQAEKMANDPDAFKKGFVPKHKSVLYATRLLQPRRRIGCRSSAVEARQIRVRLHIPGHWPVMNGIMNVVAKIERCAQRSHQVSRKQDVVVHRTRGRTRQDGRESQLRPRQGAVHGARAINATRSRCH